jgi:hypothetical protein
MELIFWIKSECVAFVFGGVKLTEIKSLYVRNFQKLLSCNRFPEKLGKSKLEMCWKDFGRFVSPRF